LRMAEKEISSFSLIWKPNMARGQIVLTFSDESTTTLTGLTGEDFLPLCTLLARSGKHCYDPVTGLRSS